MNKRFSAFMFFCMCTQSIAISADMAPPSEDLSPASPVCLSPIVSQVLSDAELQNLITYTEKVTTEGNIEGTLQGGSLTLATVSHAQHLACLTFHMSDAHAYSFAYAHPHLAIRLSWPSDKMHLLDGAISSLPANSTLCDL